MKLAQICVQACTRTWCWVSAEHQGARASLTSTAQTPACVLEAAQVGGMCPRLGAMLTALQSSSDLELAQVLLQEASWHDLGGLQCVVELSSFTSSTSAPFSHQFFSEAIAASTSSHTKNPEFWWKTALFALNFIYLKLQNWPLRGEMCQLNRSRNWNSLFTLALTCSPWSQWQAFNWPVCWLLSPAFPGPAAAVQTPWHSLPSTSKGELGPSSSKLAQPKIPPRNCSCEQPQKLTELLIGAALFQRSWVQGQGIMAPLAPLMCVPHPCPVPGVMPAG